MILTKVGIGHFLPMVLWGEYLRERHFLVKVVQITLCALKEMYQLTTTVALYRLDITLQNHWMMIFEVFRLRLEEMGNGTMFLLERVRRCSHGNSIMHPSKLQKTGVLLN